MKWREVLQAEIQLAYATTEKLMRMVDNEQLGWKPESGSNWMNTGQLLKHLAAGCAVIFRGFITGDWGMTHEQMKNMTPEEMLPPAEKMPTVDSVNAALEEMEKDKQMTLEYLSQASDKDLAEKPALAPWDESVLLLGHRLLHIVNHLNSHKMQLFYYLKLQGHDVNTSHLYN